MAASHPLLERLLRKVGATLDSAPTLDAWQAFGELVARTYVDADNDRYTIERAMNISSLEMQRLYEQLRQRTEREISLLRQSEERQRLLFDGNPLPMWVIDVETLRFVHVNHAMVELYGYTLEEFLGMRVMDVKLPDDVPETVRAILEAPDQIAHLGVRKHRCKGGAILDVDISIHRTSIDGKACVIGIGRDMTRSRRVDEELRHAQKMEAIGLLAGGIAHDFNNLLGVILANAEYSLEELGEVQASRELAQIRDAALRGGALTRQLLTFSRKQQRQVKPVALGSVVTSIEAMLARIVGEDISIITTLRSEHGVIVADPSEVEQVIMNVVVNARDAMPQGGSIRIETGDLEVDGLAAAELGVQAGPYVVLSVGDTGCGMAPEVRARIFEPFFTTKDVDKGTGLGLATVFGIMKESQGGVAVQSELGRGTTFQMYWPRAAAEVSREAAAQFAPFRGSGIVLVVEDDAQLRTILRRYLVSWGYVVLAAPNGNAALELLHGEPNIDLLLTDVVMPGGLDGRTLSHRITEQFPHVRVIFMSGYAEHAAIKSAALGPGDLLIQKPFSAQQLSEMLHRAMGPPVAT